MKVKRFFAPDMRQAMQRVREEIGPDAVIVSNHRVAGGVEVVAAHEHEYEAAQEEFKRKRAVQKRQQDAIKRSADDGRVQRNLTEELRKALLRECFCCSYQDSDSYRGADTPTPQSNGKAE